MSEKLLNTEEAAALLNVTPGSLRNMTAAREVPFIRVGKRRVRFSTEALLKWAESCTVRPEASDGK